MTDTNQTSLKQPKSFWLVFFTLGLLFFIVGYVSLRFGAVTFSHDTLGDIIQNPTDRSRLTLTFLNIRLPRVLATIIVGAALAVSGAVMQGITRNPIADPGLLGINSGAGLGLVVAYAFFHQLHYTSIILVCLSGSILASLMVFSLSYQIGKGYQQLRLILAGAMVSTFLTALGQAITTYFQIANRIIGWQAGGFVAVNWQMLYHIAPIIGFGLIMTQLLAHQLTILSLSETRSKALGQNTLLLTLIFMALVLLMASASVALAGNISFLGLIIPHFVKALFPSTYQRRLPLIAISGATFMMAVDLICRTINPPYETPLTAVISLVGLPVFLWLVRKGGRE
ncbi:FecCD family ABC transporter permease [Streptococcus uberis]|uniref:FecCD family ABC transporter permease n=1 Tax=Streptococcus uberis TaxID=1349 RepID=UPI001FF24E0F|nr:iron ABC transporter permease [Streptococcus uberis]MCK1168963.1 iron ABC transporter permease [Streptococcus uberis]MCK1186561.1 iron ABC transporter permease [Streptococcus uberis]MCK1251262.1 iron ABC transporter permease [Streptococcus uberis]MCK1257514.1 iron ABC transporter permease [Streptococcus uberis]